MIESCPLAFETGLSVAIDSRRARRGGTEVNRALGGIGRAAETAQRKVTAGAQRMGRSLGGSAAAGRNVVGSIGGIAVAVTQRLGRALTGIAAATQGVIVGIGNLVTAVTAAAAALLTLGDRFQALSNRIRAATRGLGNFEDVQRGLIGVSRRTGTDLNATIDLFQRLQLSATELGVSSTEIIQFSEAVGQLAIIGGTTGPALQAATLQLGQGLSAGILRAEEFNSVIENAPEIIRAIADGLGVSVGQLRQMVLAGEVASRDVFQALQSQTDEIQRRFDDLPITMGRAFESFQTSFVTLFGRLDELIGAAFGEGSASGIAARALQQLADLTFALSEAIDRAIPAERRLAQAKKLVADATADLNDLTKEELRLRSENIRRSQEIAAVRELEVNARVAQLESQRRELAIDITNAGSPRAQEALQPQLDVLDARIASLRQELSKLQQATQEFRDAQDTISEAFGGAPDTLKIDTLPEKFKELAEAVELDTRQLSELIEAARQGEAVFERVERQIIAENEVRKTGIDLSSEQAQILRDEIVERERLAGVLDEISQAERDRQRELEEQAERQRELAERPFLEAADNIQDAFSDTFTEIFRDGEISFRRLGDSIKDIFARLLAELVTLAIARPIIVPVIQSLGGTPGLGGAAGGLSNIFGGGGGTAGGLFDAFSLENIITLGGGIGGGLGTGARQAGIPLNAASAGGLDQIVATQAVSREPASLLSQIAGGFGQALGAAGLGFTTGSLISSLGIGNSTGSQIGGAIGGIAGSFIPIPVLGPIIGSIAGSLIGGLFGNGPSNNSAGGFLDPRNLQPTLLQAPKGQQNVGARDAILSEAASQISQVLDVIGGRVTQSVGVDVGSRDGIGIQIGGRGRVNTVDTPEQAVQEIVKLALGSVTGVSENVAAVLRNGINQPIEGLLRDLDFATFVDGLKDVDSGLTDFEIAMRDIDTAFGEHIRTARRLGIEEQQLIDARERARDAAREEAERELSSVEGALEGQANQLRSLFDSVINPLEQSIDRLRFGRESTLGPLEQLDIAQSRFDDLFGLAQRGDLDALRNIGAAGEQLVDLSREVFASGPQFVETFNSVQDRLSSILEETREQEMEIFADLRITVEAKFDEQTDALVFQLEQLQGEVQRLRNALLNAPS